MLNLDKIILFSKKGKTRGIPNPSFLFALSPLMDSRMGKLVDKIAYFDIMYYKLKSQKKTTLGLVKL